MRGREGILAVHTRNIPLADNVDIKVVAWGTPGFSGADLANPSNEAALLAARKNKPAAEMPDMEEAKDKVLMGKERRSIIITDQEKRVMAYHEAGHALIGKLVPEADLVHKVTIIPRGRALGLTQYLLIDEKYNMTKTYCLSNIAMMLSLPVAEEIVFQDITTGAANDLERATELARKMVCEWGNERQNGATGVRQTRRTDFFWGARLIATGDYSEATAVSIDEEIQKVSLTALQSLPSLNEHRNALHALA